MDALQGAAQRALAQGADAQAQATGNIDVYTATLRASVADSNVLLGEAYGSRQGRQTLKQYGDRLGIPDKVTDSIIATAQAKAREFGLDVKDLR